MHTTTTRRATATAVAAMLVLGACVEKVEQVESSNGTANVADTTGINADLAGDVMGGDLADGPTIVERFGGQEASFGTVPETTTEATGEPIKIGMINQEGTPLGSFPELRLADEAGVRFINEELGGIDGRPIELVSCITTFSPEKSQACAQQMVQEEVVAVLGGIDITSTGSIPVLEQNGLPYVGGIPINTDEMASPISFQFSGGSPGSFVAFAQHAADNGAQKVAVAYADFGPIAAAAGFGVDTLEALGVTDVTEIPFPITTTDFLPVMTAAAEGDPDAIFLGAADTACGPAMSTAYDLGIEADLYLVGACASPTIATQIGQEAVEGRIFNIEGPLDTEQIDGQLYLAVVGKYGDPSLAAAGAGTVSFRGLMNLYSVLTEIGADDVSAETVLEGFRAAVDRPSFNGHPYTCDGTPVPALPALCSPEQILVVSKGGGLEQLTDWIDVPAVLREAGVAQEPPA